MLIIGISGGSGSGKSTVVRKITDLLPDNSVSVIPQDAYYKDNSHLSPKERKRINFDHPSSIDFHLLKHHIDQLKSGEMVDMPVYSYVTCTRSSETVKLEPRRIIIIEGILILTNPGLRKRLDIKVYVEADADERLMRIIRRDIRERGRSYDDVLTHYERFVKPMHLQFIEPSRQHADIIIPQGGTNLVAIEVLTSRIKMKLFGKD